MARTKQTARSAAGSKPMRTTNNKGLLIYHVGDEKEIIDYVYELTIQAKQADADANIVVVFCVKEHSNEHSNEHQIYDPGFECVVMYSDGQLADQLEDHGMNGPVLNVLGLPGTSPADLLDLINIVDSNKYIPNFELRSDEFTIYNHRK